jgi:hypothetical protein
MEDQVPGPHSKHDGAPVLDQLPALQDIHTEREEAPDLVLQVPAGQAIQNDELDKDQVPGPQDTHEAAAGAPLIMENVPGMQSMQDEVELAPTVLDQVPALHDIHTPPNCQDPAWHVDEQTPAPAAENVPSGQFKQVAVETAPLAPE